MTGPSAQQQSAASKYCVAVDDSPTSMEALKWAAKLVKPGDELSIVSVVKPSPTLESLQGMDEAHGWEAPSKEDEEAAEKTLSKAAEVAKQMGVSNVNTAKLVAPIGGQEGVGVTISDYAKSRSCDSLVLGHRGLGTFSSAILGAMGLGSVSKYVAAHAPCNVMIHKHRQAADAMAAAKQSSAGGSAGNYKF